MQASKIIKKLMIIFFINPNLAFMKKCLSYKNINKMRILLIKLLYDKIT